MNIKVYNIFDYLHAVKNLTYPPIKNIEKYEQLWYELDFPKEKRAFSAHLTLGRLRSQKNKEAIIKKVIANKDVKIGAYKVNSIDLMKSILHPEGAEYICLKSVSI